MSCRWVRNWERFLGFFGGEREFSIRGKDLMRSVILEGLGFNSVSS